MNLLINENYLNSLLQKLAERPYSEVVHLFKGLETHVQKLPEQSPEHQPLKAVESE